MSDRPEKPTIVRILEDRSFIIALTVIAPFIILTFVIIIYLKDIEVFKDVSAVYAGWVGAVIGTVTWIQALLHEMLAMANAIKTDYTSTTTRLIDIEKQLGLYWLAIGIRLHRNYKNVHNC